MNPKVSIIIPAFNAESFIQDTIQSVLGQTYQNFEIILVDDGSNDRTLDIVKRIDDTRLRIFSVDNAGVSSARNLGIKHSTGEYISFLDSDDTWKESNLALKVKFLNVNQDIGLVHSDAIIVDQDSKPTGETLVGKQGYILKDLLSWNGTCIPGPSSILVRKSTLMRVGNFDSNISTSADKDFFFRVARDYKIGRVPEFTWNYRIHSNNMHSNIQRMQQDEIYVYNKASKNKFFYSSLFEAKCFSKMYRVLSGSWWVNQHDFKKALFCYIMSFIVYLKILPKLRM